MHHILIFGDSIAAGRKVEKIKSWPSLLAQFIDTKDKDLTLVHNVSIPGESTGEVMKRFSTEAEVRCRKVYPDDRASLIFAIGLNDAKCVHSQDNPVTGPEDFRKNIAFLAENATQYTNHIIFVGLTLVDEQKTVPIDNVYFLNDKIKVYNELLSEECQKRNATFVNIIPEWSNSDYLHLLSDDGIHPNEKGHWSIFRNVVQWFT